MNIEKYTERARGFIQSAQSLAVRDGHQQFSPLHMLKVLLDDSAFELVSGGKTWRPANYDGAFVGPISARAAVNFPITGMLLRDYPELVQSLGMVKKALDQAGRDTIKLEDAMRLRGFPREVHP